MKCEYCGRDYSDTVIDIHQEHCKVSNLVNSEDDIRAMAKAKGIKSWHVKSIDKLIEEIAELEG